MGNQILYGTANGSFGLLQVTHGKIKTSWKTASDPSSSSSASITALFSHDINGDDVPEILVISIYTKTTCFSLVSIYT